MPPAIPLAIGAMNAAAMVAVRAFRPVHPGSIVCPVLVDVEAVCHVCATRSTPPKPDQAIVPIQAWPILGFWIGWSPRPKKPESTTRC